MTTMTRADEAEATTTPVYKAAINSLQSHGFRYLYLLDFIALMGSMTIVMFLRFGTGWPDTSIARHVLGFLAATAIFMVVFYFGGLYDRELRVGRKMWLPRVSGLTLIGLVASALVILPTDRYPIPRANLIFVGILVALWVTGNRQLSRTLRVRRFGPPRILLVGSPDDIELAANHLDESDRAARIVGQITDAGHLLDTATEYNATDVMLVSEASLADIYPEPLASFEARQTGVYHRVTAKTALMGLRNVREIGGMPYVTLRTHALPQSKRAFKRTLDFLGVIILSPLLLIVGLLVALYVRIVAGRHVIYHQERTGQNGVPFDMLKFRTMTLDAESQSGPVKATADDPRVVRGCGWLRGTRLDEMPQFWNVIRGQMSVVGPRPERPELTAQYEEIIPGYGRRHEIPPGITGLAQVRGGYHTDPGYKLGHDIQYLVNWSPILDLEILVRTVWVVVRRQT
jgi:exopolysaccharide biosynthesis polyprenyl glycosylphosphotransferase